MIWTKEFEDPEEKLKEKSKIPGIVFWIKKHQSVSTTGYCCEEYKIQPQADLLL